MKKPEKKKGDYSKADYYGNLDEAKHLGYNQACDEWEEYLRELNKDKKLCWMRVR